MPTKEKLLFKLGNHRVEMWENYGIVFPTINTTNGSARMVAREAYWLVNHYKDHCCKEKFSKEFENIYDLNSSIIPIEAFKSEESLYKAIMVEWKKFDEACTNARNYNKLLELSGMLGQ